MCQNEYAIQVNKEIGYDWIDGEDSVCASFNYCFCHSP